MPAPLSSGMAFFSSLTSSLSPWAIQRNRQSGCQQYHCMALNASLTLPLCCCIDLLVKEALCRSERDLIGRRLAGCGVDGVLVGWSEDHLGQLMGLLSMGKNKQQRTTQPLHPWHSPRSTEQPFGQQVAEQGTCKPLNQQCS